MKFWCILKDLQRWKSWKSVPAVGICFFYPPAHSVSLLSASLRGSRHCIRFPIPPSPLSTQNRLRRKTPKLVDGSSALRRSVSDFLTHEPTQHPFFIFLLQGTGTVYDFPPSLAHPASRTHPRWKHWNWDGNGGALLRRPVCGFHDISPSACFNIVFVRYVADGHVVGRRSAYYFYSSHEASVMGPGTEAILQFLS